MTDHLTERPIDQLTKVCIEKSKSKSPRQLTRISRPDRPPDRPKSYKKKITSTNPPSTYPPPPSGYPLPVDLPCSPSTYPFPRRLTLYPVDLPGFTSPSGYPDFSPRQLTRISPRQLTLHTLSRLKHPLLPLPSNPLQRSYLIPPKETKKSKNILSKLRLSPTTYPLEPTGPLPDLFS